MAGSPTDLTKSNERKRNRDNERASHHITLPTFKRTTIRFEEARWQERQTISLFYVDYIQVRAESIFCQWTSSSVTVCPSSVRFNPSVVLLLFRRQAHSGFSSIRPSRWIGSRQRGANRPHRHVPCSLGWLCPVSRSILTTCLLKSESKSVIILLQSS